MGRAKGGKVGAGQAGGPPGAGVPSPTEKRGRAGSCQDGATQPAVLGGTRSLDVQARLSAEIGQNLGGG